MGDVKVNVSLFIVWLYFHALFVSSFFLLETAGCFISKLLQASSMQSLHPVCVDWFQFV